MDLTKIGKYIASKRKKLGLTQKQLAEKLGMSDKSVSKWERGICLPDVSVYIQLCNILKININEFLAGEDLNEENIVKKSEDNLIQVTKESKNRQKKLQRLIAVLIITAAVIITLLGISLCQNIQQPQNYITSIDRDSPEMKTAELLSGIDGAFLFKYVTADELESVNIYLAQYDNGALISKRKVAYLACSDLDSPSEGMIALVPDFEEFTIRLILTDSYGKYSTDLPILENVEDKENRGWGRTASQLEEETPIVYNSEQGLAAFIYGENGVSAIPIRQIESGTLEKNNDYIYFFSIQFCK